MRLVAFQVLDKWKSDLRDTPRRGDLSLPKSESLTTVLDVIGSWLFPVSKALSSELLYSCFFFSLPWNQLLALSLSAARLSCHLRTRQNTLVWEELFEVAAQEVQDDVRTIPVHLYAQDTTQ